MVPDRGLDRVNVLADAPRLRHMRTRTRITRDEDSSIFIQSRHEGGCQQPLGPFYLFQAGWDRFIEMPLPRERQAGSLIQPFSSHDEQLLPVTPSTQREKDAFHSSQITVIVP